MARNFATIDAALWDDEAFCTLSAGAQRTYLMLITQRDITAAGTLALTMRRWSKTCSEKDLEVWLAELEDARFVLIDEDTEELLVRTFVKWDGGYKHPKRCASVVANAKALRSDTLRKAVAEELAKLSVSIADPIRTESHSNGTGVPTESHRFPVNEGDQKTEPGTSTQESDPSGSNDPEPSEFCPDHPRGTDKACGPCGTAKMRHAAWVKRQERRQRAAGARHNAALLADIEASKANAVPPPADWRKAAAKRGVS